MRLLPMMAGLLGILAGAVLLLLTLGIWAGRLAELWEGLGFSLALMCMFLVGLLFLVMGLRLFRRESAGQHRELWILFPEDSALGGKPAAPRMEDARKQALVEALWQRCLEQKAVRLVAGGREGVDVVLEWALAAAPSQSGKASETTRLMLRLYPVARKVCFSPVSYYVTWQGGGGAEAAPLLLRHTPFLRFAMEGFSGFRALQGNRNRADLIRLLREVAASEGWKVRRSWA